VGKKCTYEKDFYVWLQQLSLMVAGLGGGRTGSCNDASAQPGSIPDNGAQATLDPVGRHWDGGNCHEKNWRDLAIVVVMAIRVGRAMAAGTGVWRYMRPGGTWRSW